jgi:hypothetical protein
MTAQMITENLHAIRESVYGLTAVGTRGSLEQNCAVEIFTGFFKAITTEINTIRGETKRVPRHGATPNVDVNSDMNLENPGLYHDSELIWKNEVVEQLIQVLCDENLVVSQDDGRSVIVPILAYRSLLPTRESASVPPPAEEEGRKDGEARIMDAWLEQAKGRPKKDEETQP